MDDEAASRKTPGTGSLRARRPKQDVYKKQKCAEGVARNFVVDEHFCPMSFASASGEKIECQHELWGTAPATAIKNLKAQQESFLSKS
eukprot:2249487-Pleurochrysis_carterae.AAC.1